MNAPTIDISVHVTLNDTGDPVTKVADAELHFTGGPLSGFKLIGFAVWESPTGSVRHVTFPSRQYRVQGEPRAFALLRPIDDNQVAHELRALILSACRTAEDAVANTTAAQLVRDTLLPTHRLTNEQAIELIEDITVVMGVERLNPRGAWRLIVARLGGIHNLSAHLTLLTSRHRAKQAEAHRGASQRFAARLNAGPSFARQLAQYMREAGLDATTEGTELVNYTIDAPAPDAVPQRTVAALRQTFPPSSENAGYSWDWVAHSVFEVRPDDSARPDHDSLGHASGYRRDRDLPAPHHERRRDD